MEGAHGPGSRTSLWILVLAIAFRAGLAILVDKGPGDLYRIHESVATSLLEGRGFYSLVTGQEGRYAPFITYPPGFSVVIAGVYAAAGAGDGYCAVLALMILCGSLSCLLLAHSAARAFASARLGSRAGLALAFLPTVAVLDAIPNLNATFPLFFLLLSLLLWMASDRRGGPRAFLSGLSMGLGSMFRSELILLVPALALGGIVASRFGRGSMLRAALFAAGGALAVSPWAIRNYLTFGVLSPSGPGVGLFMVDMIGKAYPDYEHGFAYGDGEILAAEGGTYTDLHWPRPYERDRERLRRALGFIGEHPLRAAWAFGRNLPLAWFGHQLYISRDIPSLQTEIASGRLLQALRDHPLGVLDRLAGMLVSLTVLVLGIRGIVRLRGGPPGAWPFLLVAGYYFVVFSVIGLLGRYTLPAYVMLLPFAVAGFSPKQRSRPEGAAPAPPTDEERPHFQ